jgi:hypothetical protein
MKEGVTPQNMDKLQKEAVALRGLALSDRDAEPGRGYLSLQQRQHL